MAISSVAITTTQSAAIWRAALLLPGETDLIESGLRELAEYLNLTRAEARRACETALADSRREWEAAPRRTPDEVLDFYRQTRSYLFEHVWWHATDPEVGATQMALLRFAQGNAGRDYLDFGSGVGAAALLFAQHGFRVTLADVSPPMLAFAQWRLERRGLAARFIDLNGASLPPQSFDLITAIDVCEHLARPAREIKRLSRALRPGGALVFNCPAGHDPERPMHLLETDAPVLRALRRHGLRLTTEDDTGELRRLQLRVARRTTNSRATNALHGWIDRARYSRLLLPPQGKAAAPRRTPHPQRVFLDHIKRELDGAPRWLDLGCGRQLVPWWMAGGAELEAELRAGARWLVGVDADWAALRDNRSCALRVQADAVALPFADASFDLVTSNMVFEHVRHPRPALAEIRRVLRPGGRLLVLTPNWLDLVTLAARAVPNRWHAAIVSRAEQRAAADVYPTHFRFNRPATIARLLAAAGFARWRIEPLQQPDTYTHIPFVARVETFWHRLAATRPALRGALLIEAEA